MEKTKQKQLLKIYKKKQTNDKTKKEIETKKGIETKIKTHKKEMKMKTK